MQKLLYKKAFLSFFVFIFSFFSIRLEAIVCQLCNKLEAHLFSFNQDSENCLWEKPTLEGEQINNHSLCQCCASLCIARNYDFQTGFFHDKCPICQPEKQCSVRINPWKVVVTDFTENPKELIAALQGNLLKILVIKNAAMFYGLLPVEFQAELEGVPEIKILLEKENKKFFFGIICKEIVDLDKQSKVLFGDAKLETDPTYQGIQGFYNAAVIIIDPESGRPVSYALPDKPELFDENQLKECLVTCLFKGINCRKTTYFIPNPLG